MKNYYAAFRFICRSILMLFLANAPTFAAKLVFTDVTTSSVTQMGVGQGKRTLYTKAGTVGGLSVDLVAKLVTATTNPSFGVMGSRISINSSGFDTIWVDWYIYKTGTYKLATIPVAKLYPPKSWSSSRILMGRTTRSFLFRCALHQLNLFESPDNPP